MTILLVLLLSACDERSWNWTWSRDWTERRGVHGWEKTDWSFNPAYAAFNALELLTCRDEKTFAKRMWSGYKISKHIYFPATKVDLDYTVEPGKKDEWCWMLHGVPKLGYSRCFVAARFGGRFHLFACDMDDHAFHNYEITK